MSFDTYGVSVDQLRKITGCTLDTARRWKRTKHVPRYAARLLRVFFHGDLGEMNRDWSGWTLNKNGLCGPTGDRPFRPGNVLTIGLNAQRISALQHELEVMRKLAGYCEHCAHCNRADPARVTLRSVPQ